jgi:hypothetical protein
MILGVTEHHKAASTRKLWDGEFAPQGIGGDFVSSLCGSHRLVTF